MMALDTDCTPLRGSYSTVIIPRPMTSCRTGKVVAIALHGAGRSAIDSHSDPHRELKKKFAHQLADMLARGLEQHTYDRLDHCLSARRTRRFARGNIGPCPRKGGRRGRS